MTSLNRPLSCAVAAALVMVGLSARVPAMAASDQPVAKFTFETGGTALDGGGAIANVRGTAKLVDGPTGKVASIGSGFWMDVTKKDGSPLLAGLTDATISYDSKPNATGNTGWTVFAAASTATQTYGNEKYLGYLDRTTGVTVERYANTGGRNSAGNLVHTQSNSAWKHVDLELSGGTARLYVDRQLVSVNTTGKTLPEILGASGGVLQVLDEQ